MAPIPLVSRCAGARRSPAVWDRIALIRTGCAGPSGLMHVQLSPAASALEDYFRFNASAAGGRP
jgi:hypothetical protein